MAQTDVVQEARGRWHSILMQLGMDEKFLRNAHSACPFCGGKDRWRWDDKDGTGSFYCNHCEPHAGDGFALLMRLKGVDFKAAADLVREIIPLAQSNPVEEKRDRLESVRQHWAKANPVVERDFVWNYLQTRGVLPNLLPTGDVLRCAEIVPYYEERKQVGAYPAMLAVVRDPSGKPMTLHCTYLDGNGGKAAVASPKKVLSKSGQSAVIRLYRATGHVCLAEGIETALAVRVKTNMPVWSCICESGLSGFVCPPEIKSVDIWSDADANYVGQSASYSLAKRLVQEGKNVKVMVPFALGSDWAS